MNNPATRFLLAVFAIVALLCVRSEAAAITADDARTTIRANDYTQAEADKWEVVSRNAVDDAEKLTARVLLVELWLKSGTPFTLKETREKLKGLIRDAPDSWQAQISRMQIMRTFDVNTETDDMIAAANEALDTAKFDLLNNPQDPFLISYLETLYAGVNDLREFFIYMRGACYATDLNAERLKADFDLLAAGELKTQLGYRLREIEAMTPEQRARHWQMLAAAVGSADRQQKERRAITK